MTQPSDVRTRHCPKCGSVRVHRSRRRGIVESVLSRLGAEICRCHDCRSRRAWFGLARIRLNAAATDEPQFELALFGTGFVACILFVWWMITRYTGLSG